MTDTDKLKFRIFRAGDAKLLGETDAMSLDKVTPVQLEGLKNMRREDLNEGDTTRVLVDLPGFHLIHVWFKKDFPLPLHSHDSDCLYYIIAGSLSLGTEELGPRDSFFIPADVPYTYKPGPDGVELLEFRHATHFDFKIMPNKESYWNKFKETLEQNSDEWAEANMPPLNMERDDN